MNLFKESEEIVIFNVEKEQDLETFLFSKDISGRFFRKLYKKKHIYINGKAGKRKERLKSGDIVSLFIEEEKNDFKHQKMGLNIIYEDYDLLIINKEPFIVVHPTKSHEENTLSNGIAYYFHEKGINRKIRFVNRLDMNTSGILIVAKNAFSHQQLSLQFEDNQVKKRYKALVKGVVENDEGYIDIPIGNEEGDIERKANSGGKESITRYKVIERYGIASLLDIELLTGRTHQIRVHLNYIGHPIIGDTLYDEECIYINRQALHSYYLKIKGPRTCEDIQLICELPEDIKEAIKQIQSK